MARIGVTADEEGGSIWMALGVVQTFITMVKLGWLIGQTPGGWIGGLKIGPTAGVFFALTTSACNFICQTSLMGLLPIDWSHLLAV